MMMLQELDSSFQAVLLVGYHSGTGSGCSPLEHTMDGSSLIAVKINGREISEFMIDLYNTAFHHIPLVFVSGDQGLCETVKQLNPHIETVAVKEGRGDSTINLHPQLAIELIRDGTTKALLGNLEACQVDLPDHFNVEVVYRLQAKAYQFGFFPGAQQVDPRTVSFETSDYFEVLRFFLFAL
jgi:D-amino peptidase